jgi:hypothetical protein
MRRSLLAAVLASLAFTALVVAQQSSLSRIRGTVRESSGKVLPGVTVTIASSALPDSALSTTTDSDGLYGFAELPEGMYSIKFALAGFATIERPPFRMLASINARIDAEMKSEPAR